MVHTRYRAYRNYSHASLLGLQELACASDGAAGAHAADQHIHLAQYAVLTAANCIITQKQAAAGQSYRPGKCRFLGALACTRGTLRTAQMAWGGVT